MKNYYELKSGETLVATFEEQSDAYEAKRRLRRSDQDHGYLHVDPQTVFETFGEWDGLGNM